MELGRVAVQCEHQAATTEAYECLPVKADEWYSGSDHSSSTGQSRSFRMFTSSSMTIAFFSSVTAATSCFLVSPRHFMPASFLPDDQLAPVNLKYKLT